MLISLVLKILCLSSRADSLLLRKAKLALSAYFLPPDEFYVGVGAAIELLDLAWVGILASISGDSAATYCILHTIPVLGLRYST